MSRKEIKVLSVDDSSLIRQILIDGLNNNPRIAVVGVAKDPFEARDLIV